MIAKDKEIEEKLKKVFGKSFAMDVKNTEWIRSSPTSLS